MIRLFSARSWVATVVIYSLLSDGFAASLTWDTQQVDLTVKTSDKVAISTFHFVNSGQNTITIASVNSDCGCTTAELVKRTYAPGEAGEIKTVFVFEGRVGLQQKTVQVATDDEPAKPTELILRVNIVEPVTCSPRLLLWRLGEEKSEKVAVFTAVGTNRVKSIEFKPSVPTDVDVRIETVEAEKKFRLSIQPTSMTKEMQTTIACVITMTDGTTQALSVFALVK